MTGWGCSSGKSNVKMVKKVSNMCYMPNVKKSNSMTMTYLTWHTEGMSSSKLAKTYFRISSWISDDPICDKIYLIMYEPHHVRLFLINLILVAKKADRQESMQATPPWLWNPGQTSPEVQKKLIYSQGVWHITMCSWLRVQEGTGAGWGGVGHTWGRVEDVVCLG